MKTPKEPKPTFAGWMSYGHLTVNLVADTATTKQQILNPNKLSPETRSTEYPDGFGVRGRVFTLRMLP